MNTEPVLTGGAFAVFINSVIAALAAFGIWHPSTDELAAVNLVVVNAAVIVSAALARRKVTPVAHLTTIPANAKGAPPNG